MFGVGFGGFSWLLGAAHRLSYALLSTMPALILSGGAINKRQTGGVPASKSNGMAGAAPGTQGQQLIGC
jgi:hypothetical protein